MKIYLEVALYNEDEETGMQEPFSLTPEEQSQFASTLSDVHGYSVTNVWFIEEAEAELFKNILDESTDPPRPNDELLTQNRQLPNYSEEKIPQMPLRQELEQEMRERYF